MLMLDSHTSVGDVATLLSRHASRSAVPYRRSKTMPVAAGCGGVVISGVGFRPKTSRRRFA
jgi:hypothetical protein